MAHALLHRFYLGTGTQLPAFFRQDDGTPKRDLIEAHVLRSLADEGFLGATIWWSTGYWECHDEATLVVEVLDTFANPGITTALRGVVLDIKRKFTQDSVLLTCTPLQAEFL